MKTGRFADSGTLYLPLSDEEIVQMQDLVDSFYADFLARVSVGRKLTTNHVDKLGQARVWSDTATKRIGLVDELGGLNAAITDAAQRAKLGKYAVAEYRAVRLHGIDQGKLAPTFRPARPRRA